jgi:Rieske Fe-S protein
VPGFLHAPAGKVPSDDEIALLQEDGRTAQELGFDALFIESVPFVGTPGVRFANQAKLHPAKFLSGLLKKFPSGGSFVFENTEVTEISGDPPIVKAAGYTIHCNYVVIATHVPLQGATGTVSAALFQTKLAPYSTYAIGARIPSKTVPQASFWDTADPYFYLRIDRHKRYDYAILGGADHKTGQARDPEHHYAQVEKRMRGLFPKCEILHRWSGQVVETHDGLPFIGETAPKQFVATGFSGNGFTFGPLSAMMACDAFHGRANPWRSLFDTNRKQFPAGLWDYLRENADYPYYMIKQMLARPDASSTRGVKRGHGQVIVQDGAKVAAYRDDQGKLTLKSAICPHMGCVVRWNGADKTWDCPCHGSRFQATGEAWPVPRKMIWPIPARNNRTALRHTHLPLRRRKGNVTFLGTRR